MTNNEQRTRSMIRGALALLVTAAFYEAVARSGFFPAVLLPTIPTVVSTLIDTLSDGTMLTHAAFTLYRV
ncbi:MAG TPA: hypothetical protein VK522_11890, partial [Pseudolabrys sp.]|nr:hypothetical protein [Pseudolabrys sp.]